MSKLPAIDPHKPVRLVPVHIPKPWGQEIWYTGMETRGESHVLVGEEVGEEVSTEVGTEKVPLSTYLAADPAALTKQTPVLLLKVLDPKPSAVVGDLYFEVHEHKQEVYVVTHVDPAAWPDGVGGIRFGMCQEKRKAFEDPHAFRAAYADAVNRYRQIRVRLDELHEDVPVEQEIQARTDMESFTAMRELRLGDIVRVPTWTPHSLQHGVRVVEFQTPTYERYIISFAQQVLTQDHWDSAHAIDNMHLDTPAAETFESVSPGVDRVASFDDFNVWRADLSLAAPLQLSRDIPYAVCMCLSGTVDIGEISLAAEQACFIPFSALKTTTLANAGQVLIAAPNL